jgi:osmotically-inducible protein OsmY
MTQREAWMERILWVLGLLSLLALAGLYLGGCGGSAIRAHATAASMAMGSLEAAGSAIESGTQLSIRECTHGATRCTFGDAACDECLDQVQERSEIAASVHDTMIPAIHAYRDTVLLAGQGDGSDQLLSMLLAAALRIAREWDALREALSTLHVDLPPIPFPVPGGAS